MRLKSRSGVAHAALPFSTGASARCYPNEPIRWIIDCHAAGNSDILARIKALA